MMPPRPRIWPVFVVPVLALITSAVASIVALGLGAVLAGHGFSEDALREFLLTPVGFLIAILASQLTLLVAAVIPAILSPVPLGRRLGLGRGRVSPGLWPMLMLGTFTATGIGGVIRVILFRDEESSTISEIQDVLASVSPAWGLALALAIGILPGLCEELLFRGYVQRRLLRRFHPSVAIGIASIAFVAFHLDLLQAISITPLAFWLGYVGWRTGSVWPCVLCHLINNTVTTGAFVVMNRGYDPNQTWIALIFVFGVGASITCFVLSILALELRGPYRPESR